MASPSKYAKTGVDVKKVGTEVFKKAVTNLYPNAFCVLVQDPNPRYLMTLHMDGQGSGAVENWLMYKRTGNTKWFGYAADDVLAMNIDDIVCVGAEPYAFVDNVSINGFTCPKKDVLRELSDRFKYKLDALRKEGIDVAFCGGETADLPDQVRTVTFDGAAYGRVKKSQVIDGSKIRPDDWIVAFRSGGQAKYEDVKNSGIMSNGRTLARHCLTHPDMEKEYPEIREPHGDSYWGRFYPETPVKELDMMIGEALTSPTRIYAPIVNAVLETYRGNVTGIVHNTGGGQTKCLRLGSNLRYVKVFDPMTSGVKGRSALDGIDPIFYLIQRESKENWQNMFQAFNMGWGMEMTVRGSKALAEDIADISSRDFGVEAAVIGYLKRSDGKNRVEISFPSCETLVYE